MAAETLSRIVHHRTGRPKPPMQTDGTPTPNFLVIGNSTTDHHILPDQAPGLRVDTRGHGVIERTKNASQSLVTNGGNGYNIANAIGLLGGDVVFTTPSPSYDTVESSNLRGINVVALRPKEGDGEIRRSYILNLGGQRFTFGNEVEREYTVPLDSLHNTPIAAEKLPEPEVVVLSSADGELWGQIYHEATDYAKRRGAMLAVLPSSKQLKPENIASPDLDYAMENADIVGLNREELVNLLKARNVAVDSASPMLELLSHAFTTWGSDKYYSVTNDGHPSVLATPDGRVLAQRNYGEGGETTLGAGDAYISALIHALASGQSEKLALMRAAINGYATTFVVDTTSGHQTLDEFEAAIGNAPRGFEPIQIFPTPYDVDKEVLAQLFSEIDAYLTDAAPPTGIPSVREMSDDAFERYSLANTG